MSASGSVTPKRRASEESGRAGAYPYYAGFSFPWAVEVLESLNLGAGDCVLDAWNGGGTTTTAASSLGLPSVGIDRNPVATAAALARCASARAIEGLNTLVVPDDARSGAPLGATWLSTAPAQAAGGIYAGLLDQVSKLEASERDRCSVRNAVHVVAFMALRQLTRAFEGSNPTWVRTPKSARARLRPGADVVRGVFEFELARLRDVLSVEDISFPRQPSIVAGSSEALPLPAGSVAAALTSPPYCTRIDYAVATRRELEVLGVVGEPFARLRRELLGTTLNRSSKAPAPPLGGVGAEILKSIWSHHGRDSKGYYFKHFAQYFDSLVRSLRELHRVLRDDGVAVVVVQDSYYYDVHIPLAEIVAEVCEGLGMSCSGSEALPVRRNLITLNSRARSQRGKDAIVNETVLTLTKRRVRA